MKLQELSLINFKAIRYLKVEPQGGNIDVFGDNGTGKTTLLDAFLWLFFGRDSFWRNEFDLKTLDAAGKALPMLEHSVEVVIEHQGETSRIKKTLTESWVKARGSASAEFSGHKTSYEINGIPLAKKEFDAAIGKLCDETLLRLLTDPGYFAGKLPWQERRRILMELCGELTDAEVIGTDEALASLPAYLAGRTIEEHRRLVAARKTALNAELRSIPVRVDEVARSLPEPVAALTDDQSKLAATVQSRLASETAALRKLQQRRDQQQVKLASCQRSRRELTEDAARLQTRLAEKRAEWNRVSSELFRIERSDRCPACGQPIPEALAEAACLRARTRFEEEQSRRLERLTAEGQALLMKQQELERRQQELEAALPTQEAELARAEATLGELQVAQETERISCGDEAQRLVAELARQAAASAQREQGRQRIDELQRQEKALSEEYAGLERQLFLTEEFMRIKVRLLESKINSCFRLARFRLYEQQINGALNEVCEVLGPDGVPYNSGLNNAARINIGLDIIRSLSEFYDFSAPVFIDNAEAVVELIDMPAQRIRLLVSAGDHQLRVERAERVEQVERAESVKMSSIVRKTAAPEVFASSAAAAASGPGF